MQDREKAYEDKRVMTSVEIDRMRTVTRATISSSLLTRHLQAVGVLKKRLEYMMSNIPCAGRVLNLELTAPIIKCFALLNNVLTYWRWAERPGIDHRQSGKTSKSINSIVGGPNEVQEKEGFPSYLLTI